MRHSAKLASMMLLPVLSLGACSGSGFWRYEEDTFTLPGANPNLPVASSENYLRSRHGTLENPAPLLTDAGDIWPAPTQGVPTLKDLQKQQAGEVGAGADSTGPALAPLPPLPSLPGFEISQQDPGTAAPPLVYSKNAVPTHNGVMPIQGEQGYKPSGSAGNGNIVVPNGNGTSTVISPSGQVTTIPTPK